MTMSGNWTHLLGHVVRGLIDLDVVMKYLAYRSGNGIVKRDISGYTFHLDPLDRGECQPLLKYGWHAEDNISTYETCVKKVREKTDEPIVVIDIGANIGYTVLAAASHLSKSDTIYAIEPDPDSFSLLKKNIKSNHTSPTVELLQTAFGAQTGSATLTQTKKSNRRTVDTEVHSEGVKIDIITVDELIKQEQIILEQIGVIQMDIEGFESEVFTGMEQFLEKSRSPIIIFMELHSFIGEEKRNSIINALEDAGFNCDIIFDEGSLKPITFDELRSLTDRCNLVAQK